MALNRDTIVVALIAVLAVTGVALLAATIDTTYAADIPGFGSDEGPPGGGDFGDGGIGDGVDDETTLPGEGGEQSPLEIPTWCIPFLTSWQGILLIAGSIIGFVLLAFFKFGFVAAAFVGYLIGMPSIVAYGLLTQCPVPGETGDDTSSPLVDFLSDTAAEGALTSTPLPPEVLMVVFVIAALTAVIGLVYASGSEELDAMGIDEDEDPSLEDFAAAAGRAADRIEETNASIDNAVYRAWAEMTALLRLENARSATPAEFAEKAISVGMKQDDVEQLTTLFVEVRYGEMDPAPREELAITTLRNIEKRYGESTIEQRSDVHEEDDGDDDK